MSTFYGRIMVHDESADKSPADKTPERESQSRQMSAAEVLARLSDHARGSMKDFLSFDESGAPQIDLKKAEQVDKLHLIRRVRLTDQGAEVDLYDAQEALIQLGRHYRLFVDRVQTENWRARAIEDIKAGVVTFEALASAFDETLALELFQQAGMKKSD
ncbi:MAG: terminase small subunit [Anaerolinea sp.]|nr:terminase small subunit [Anaerolinea sp.]